MANKINGINLASGNNFQLSFPVIPGNDKIDRLLTLNVFETIIPDVTFSEDMQHWQGWDFKHITSNLDFAAWTFEFSIDENFENWKKIFNWMKFINNNRDKVGENINEYMVDASLSINDNYDNIIMELKFVNVFPTSLGTVTLSDKDGEQYLMTSVTLLYTYFDIVP